MFLDFSTSKVNPIFVVEILLDNDNLMSIPDSADFQDRLKVLLADYISSVKSLDRLREDVCFRFLFFPPRLSFFLERIFLIRPFWLMIFPFSRSRCPLPAKKQLYLF